MPHLEFNIQKFIRNPTGYGVYYKGELVPLTQAQIFTVDFKIAIAGVLAIGSGSKLGTFNENGYGIIGSLALQLTQRPIKVTRYLNIYQDLSSETVTSGIYENEEHAKICAQKYPNKLKVLVLAKPIEWEE